MSEYLEGHIPPPSSDAQQTLPHAPVVLADGEIYARKYEAVRAGGGSGGTGTLYITNQRVIFYAAAKGRGTQRESSLLQQTRLKDITGVAAYVSYRLSLGLLLLTLFFGLLLVAALFSRSPGLIAVTAIIVAFLVLLLIGSSSRRGGAGVIIHSASTETSPINFGSFAAQRSHALRWLLGPFAALFRAYTAFDVTLGTPGADSDRLIAEIGALILDMQQRGDDALRRWGKGEGKDAGKGEGKSEQDAQRVRGVGEL